MYGWAQTPLRSYSAEHPYKDNLNTRITDIERNLAIASFKKYADYIPETQGPTGISGLYHFPNAHTAKLNMTEKVISSPWIDGVINKIYAKQ